MKPLPNALRQELARSQTTGPHPDADLLTAFCENTLLARERKEVLAHLAGCAACRTVVHLAEAPASEPVSAAAAPSRSPRRLWVPLFAAAGFAGAALVTVIVLHHPSPAAPAPVEIATNSKAEPPAPQAAIATPVPKPALAKKKAPAHPAVPEKTQPARDETRNSLAQAAPAARMDLVQPQQQYQEQALQQAANQARQAKVAPEEKSSHALSVTTFGETAPIVAGNMAAPPRAHWRLSTTGEVERAIADGPWQTVLATPKMRVISVAGSDVWAGGD
ncbi:MAG TPA: zf-HC2 domain-containing protein, partial [Acidobacteriaceae bacterium]|nr:zf-HC2 domain-containing protein [Acidobacteriaceae bacterium]